MQFLKKELACYAGNTGDPISIPGSGRSPGGGNGKPLQYSCLEKSHGQRNLVATAHGVAKSRTWLSTTQPQHTVSTQLITRLIASVSCLLEYSLCGSLHLETHLPYALRSSSYTKNSVWTLLKSSSQAPRRSPVETDSHVCKPPWTFSLI